MQNTGWSIVSKLHPTINSHITLSYKKEDPGNIEDVHSLNVPVVVLLSASPSITYYSCMVFVKIHFGEKWDDVFS